MRKNILNRKVFRFSLSLKFCFLLSICMNWTILPLIVFELGAWKMQKLRGKNFQNISQKKKERKNRQTLFLFLVVCTLLVCMVLMPSRSNSCNMMKITKNIVKKNVFSKRLSCFFLAVDKLLIGFMWMFFCSWTWNMTKTTKKFYWKNLFWNKKNEENQLCECFFLSIRNVLNNLVSIIFGLGTWNMPKRQKILFEKKVFEKNWNAFFCQFASCWLFSCW